MTPVLAALYQSEALFNGEVWNKLGLSQIEEIGAKQEVSFCRGGRVRYRGNFDRDQSINVVHNGADRHKDVR